MMRSDQGKLSLAVALLLSAGCTRGAEPTRPDRDQPMQMLMNVEGDGAPLMLVGGGGSPGG
ncbi:MAG: hypothetical protein H0X64_15525 [Gemmatimonadaceae bacterium]|nr:hypothetical protein [Gemmatimonadaceae bacterium]